MSHPHSQPANGERGQKRTPQQDEGAQNRAHAREDSPKIDPGSIHVELAALNRDLSKGERSLLAVLLDPKFFNKGPAERAPAARLSVRRYHEIMQREDFRKVVHEAQRSALQGNIAPIIAAAVESACTPTDEGHQDRKLLLEIVGYYNPRQQITHTITSTPGCGIVGITHEQLAALEAEGADDAD